MPGCFGGHITLHAEGERGRVWGDREWGREERVEV